VDTVAAAVVVAVETVAIVVVETVVAAIVEIAAAGTKPKKISQKSGSSN